MGFRLATVDGRAVLIDGAAWHDLAAASEHVGERTLEGFAIAVQYVVADMEAVLEALRQA